MNFVVVLSLLILPSVPPVHAAIDQAPIRELASTVQGFPTNAEPTKSELKRLFKAIRENHEAMANPIYARQVQTTLAETLDADVLSWWNAHVDEVIEQMSARNYDLARGLSCIAKEQSGTVKTGWRSNLDAIAAVLILLPLEFFMGGGRSTLLHGAIDLAKLSYARDVLAFRGLIKEAYAENCAGALAERVIEPGT